MPDYRTRLQKLGLRTLFYRRTLADVLMGFKILRGEVCLRASKYWNFRPIHERRACFNLTPPRFKSCDGSLQESSFFWRVTKLLNKLPASFLTIENSSILKAKLKKTDILSVLKIDDVV
ncbi:hypothetical protein Y032_0299g1781 [Ancylostoma ceylanicum]|uniref:Uncharacterized protein n=1 Tax=Ancylostoma ceylanicum TaxID=53326 RepID=A0A016S3Z9_9BILA|nr:hypothetical protein Y032_0299g1781 [Ancylostoma ceylanicum]